MTIHKSVVNRIIFIIFLLLFMVASVAMAQPRKVRVGFFRFQGYHEINSLDERSGYGYELLQLMNRYNDWQYVYLGYDKSWSQAQQMLANGEIDLLTSAQKTPGRLGLYDFSDLPVGTSYTILTVKDGDKRFVEGNYQTYNNMRVGMLRDNSRNASFASFAAQNKFVYLPVYYDSMEAMIADLQAGKNIDAIVSSNLRKIKEEWVLERLDPSPFYVIVRKGDKALLQEVNKALTRMDIDMPGWRIELTNKFYAVKNGDNLSFNKEEQEYLQNLKNRHKVLSVLVNPDRAPYSYLKNGEIQGIIPRIFKEIAKRIGIEYEFVKVQSRQDYINQSTSGNVDIILDSIYDLYWAEMNNFRLTQPYLGTPQATVRKKNFQENEGQPVKVAVVEKSEYMLNRLFWNKESHEPMICPDVKSCIAAVEQGKADETFLYLYTAQKVVADDVSNALKMTILPGTNTDFSFAVTDKESYLLVDVLNKGVQSMLSGSTDIIVLDELSTLQDQISFLGFIYDNPMLILAIVATVLILLAGLLVSIQRRHNAELEKKRAEEAKKIDEAKNRDLQDALSTAQQASSAKGNFLSRMSHEIRTPLNAVIGFLSLAKLDQNSPNLVNEYVDKCIVAAEQLLGIINDVLDMSAIEGGKLRLAQEAYSLGNLLREVKSIFASQAKTKEINFYVDATEVENLTVIGDQLRLKQVLTNLLSNAVKFTDKGGVVRLKALLIADIDNVVRLKFEVMDNGIGMEPTFLKHLFEPFNQASATTAQKYGGSGLGLSITKNLVNMMQGSLDVVSVPGHGSTFTVALSLPKGEKQASKQDMTSEADSSQVQIPKTLQGLRVLLAEDNFINREIAVKLLDKAGAVVTNAENGQEAVEKFLHAQPGFQIILMDIQMPVMNGYEATRKIRASGHPDAKKIPIIAMTANAFNEDVAAALAAGMNGHISKPIDLQVFYDTLEQAKNWENR